MALTEYDILRKYRRDVEDLSLTDGELKNTFSFSAYVVKIRIDELLEITFGRLLNKILELFQRAKDGER